MVHLSKETRCSPPPLTEAQLAAAVRKANTPIPNLNMSSFSPFPSHAYSSPISSTASNAEQITIDLNSTSFPLLDLQQFSDFVPSSAPATGSTNEIDVFQMFAQQTSNHASPVGVDQGMLDPSQLQLQLDQLQAEIAIQQPQVSGYSDVYNTNVAPIPSLPIAASNVPQVPATFEQMLMQSFSYMTQPQQQQHMQVPAPASDPFSLGVNVDLSAAAAASVAVSASNSFSSSLSATSSFSSDYSANSSFSAPSPVDYSPSHSHSHTPARSVSPAGPSNVEMYAELERRKREVEEKRQEFERHEAELQLFAATCAHSMIHSEDAVIM